MYASACECTVVYVYNIICIYVSLQAHLRPRTRHTKKKTAYKRENAPVVDGSVWDHTLNVALCSHGAALEKRLREKDTPVCILYYDI